MLNIKKKIIALGVVCAMAVSMAACSDKKDGDSSDSTASNSEAAVPDVEDGTLSSEDAEKLKKVELNISEYVEPEGVQQDPVEQSSSVADNGSEADTSGNNNNGNSNNTPDSSDSEPQLESSMLEIPSGDSQDSGNSGNNDNNSGNNNSGDNNNSGNNSMIDSSGTITGTKKTQQAVWMDLSGDFTFDGEFITAEFKIKDTTANGVYPITIDWLDFANIKAVSLTARGINGSVAVGGAAETNEFVNDGSFEVKADCVSGKPGDTVSVTFRFNKNPGICASIFRFGYDSDALEYVGGSEGADFTNALETQNQ